MNKKYRDINRYPYFFVSKIITNINTKLKHSLSLISVSVLWCSDTREDKVKNNSTKYTIKTRSISDSYGNESRVSEP